VNDDDVIDQAAELGFEPVDRVLRGVLVYGWSRSGDERFPCYLTRREALSWMGDRLMRCAAFA
jgi:hypothetical protein